MSFRRDPQFDLRTRGGSDTWDQAQAGVIVRGDFFGEFLAAEVATRLDGAAGTATATWTGVAYTSIAAESAIALAGAAQTMSSGTTTVMASSITLEGAFAAAALEVIAYAQSGAALDGVSGSAAATLPVTGSISAWLEGVQSGAIARVDAHAQAIATLEGVMGRGFIRAGGRDFRRDVSARTARHALSVCTRGASVAVCTPKRLQVHTASGAALSVVARAAQG